MSRSSETTSAVEARQDDTEDRTQAPDERPSFRSRILGAQKHRWTGMKPTQRSAESGRRLICFVCGVWPAEEPSIVHSRTPVSRLFSKPTSWGSLISAEYSLRFATITSRVR